MRHRAARHRGVRVGVLEQVQRRAAPVGEHRLQPLHDRMGAEYTAVEQQRVRCAKVGMLLQEGGDVAGDCGIARIRQAEGDERTGAAARRQRIGRHVREEAVDDACQHRIALQFDRAGAADQL